LRRAQSGKIPRLGKRNRNGFVQKHGVRSNLLDKCLNVLKIVALRQFFGFALQNIKHSQMCLNFGVPVKKAFSRNLDSLDRIDKVIQKEVQNAITNAEDRAKNLVHT